MYRQKVLEIGAAVVTCLLTLSHRKCTPYRVPFSTENALHRVHFSEYCISFICLINMLSQSFPRNLSSQNIKKLDSKAERQLLLIGIANGATKDLFYRGGRTSEAEIRNGPRCQLVLPCLP